MRNKEYTSNLAKGCGLVEETLSLLSIFEENTTKESLTQYVHDNNFLSKCTAKRSNDIVNRVFYPRFMKDNPSVPLWLKMIRSRGLMLGDFKQLLMVYCARENAIMYDYIINVLWHLRAEGYNQIPANSFTKYVDQLADEGKVSWSDIMKKKCAGYIKSALVDFDIINRRSEILQYDIATFTLLYFLHEMHFSGMSDLAIWDSEDWSLFGLNKYALQEKILANNMRGGYIAQCTGDLMTISWNHKTMEDFINELL